MSIKTKAVASVVNAAQKAGGSHLTRQGRERTMRQVIEATWARGQKITGIETLRERHIAAYVQEKLKAGVSKRTLQSRVSDIRMSMKAAGRGLAADSSTISNQALGLDGVSREGTRAPASAMQFEAAEKAADKVDAGIAAAVRLQLVLGLRSQEAVRSGASLASWEKQIEAGDSCRIVFGTKNGRPRDTSPVDRHAALEAVRAAKAVAKQRGGKLIPGDLKQASNRYRNTWSRNIGPASGLTSHQLRSAYALADVNRYQGEKLSRKEAEASVSCDLGHGDGRGRWVSHVYLAKAVK